MSNVNALKIFIADDNTAEAESLKNILITWSIRTDVEVDIEVRNTLSFDEECIASACSSSILFLDIELPEINGIEFAKKIRSRSSEPIIVYTTNYSKYSLDGYEALARAYLIKPISRQRMDSLLNSVRFELMRRDDSPICFSYRRENYIFPLRKIIYIESQNHACKLVSIDAEQRFPVQLKQIISDTTPARRALVRCHKSFVVNIAHIVKFSAERLTMSNGATVPIGRAYCSAVKEAIAKHLNEAAET